MNIERLAAFSIGDTGGNPAGVVRSVTLPSEGEMQQVAAEVGYSEPVFAAPTPEGWRVRYFAPAREIPFCGHATIALGAALAMASGDGVFSLELNAGRITVEGTSRDGVLGAALQSPPTRSQPATAALLERALAIFGYKAGDLDMRLPPAVIEAGAAHLLLALQHRSHLEMMQYDFDEGRALMLGEGLATVALVHAEGLHCFRARHPFAGGGVYEDPATGAGAAALAGYLRDVAWPHHGHIVIQQGVEMGVPCRLEASFGDSAGSSIRVAGQVRHLE